MKLLHKVLALFRRKALEREMAEEMRAHLDGLAERNVAAGMSPEEARYAARRAFGGVEQIKESAREERGFLWLERLQQDARYAARSLRKSPGFTVVAILVLAIGIGVSAAAFTFFNAILLRSLPVSNPSQLVLASYGTTRGRGERFSYAAYELFRDHARTMAGLAAVTRDSTFLTATGLGQRNAVEIRFTAVSGNFFSVLGVPPFAGRTLIPEDDNKDDPQAVVVLSYSFWQRNFNADTQIIGKKVLLDKMPFVVVGIGRPGFFGYEPGAEIDVWLPIQALPFFDPAWKGNLSNRNGGGIQIIGRLRSGATREVASAELDSVYQRLADELAIPVATRAERWGKVSLQPGGNGRLRLGPDFNGAGIRQLLSTLMGVVALVLVISCANVGSLLLVRTAARQREFALRAALGAERGRLVGHLMMEGLFLSVAGGLLGLVVLRGMTNAFAGLLVEPTESSINLSPDLRVLLFAAAASACTGILVGLFPALWFSQIDLVSAVKSLGNTVAGSSRQRLSKILVVVQIGLSLGLLACAGLLVRSFQSLEKVTLGFDREHLLLVEVGIPRNYGDRRSTLAKDLLAAVGALPDVRSVTIVGRGLIGGAIFSPRAEAVSVEGYVQATNEKVGAYLSNAGPRFLKTMGVPLLRGRDMTLDDVFPDSAARSLSGPAVIISESLARRFFANSDPIGRHIDTPSLKNGTIIGVAGNVKFGSLRDDDQLVIYSPLRGGLTLALRTADDPLILAQSVRAVVTRIDPNVPVDNVQTMDDVVNRQLSQDRIIARASGWCSVFAWLLACLGLFGLLSHNVAQRTREMGVRMALGASANNIVGLIVGQAMKLALLGGAIGVVGAAVLTRFIASRLYGVTTTDPVTYIGVALSMGAVALVACWLPARRATKVDPMVALRCE
jgi:predicted permease